MKVVEDETMRVRVMDGLWSAGEVARALLPAAGDEPFYVMDLGEVVARHQRWRALMPRVVPYYAVKCNDDRLLLATLAALGTGFDCASKKEIEIVTALGVQPERIIFANPAKMASHIRHAGAAGVDTMTFDSEIELMKIKGLLPSAKLVIRIRCDAANAQCPLGIKFGCDPVEEAPRLLKLAAVMNLDVVGVSFHVGSGAGETGVYARAIQFCAALFALGNSLGLRMTLLDLGGGWPGGSGDDISEVAGVINAALEQHFPAAARARVIAEPGRYFAAAAYTLATTVHAKRMISTGSEELHSMYFINDGVYGSFNCILYDHQRVRPELLEPSLERPTPCSIWGPSCDGLDCVVARAALPPLPAGAVLLWRDMGAYTLPIASPFNGFPVPKVHAVLDRALWLKLRDPLNRICPVVEEGAPPSPAVTPPPASPPPEDPAPLPHTPVYLECALK